MSLQHRLFGPSSVAWLARTRLLFNNYRYIVCFDGVLVFADKDSKTSEGQEQQGKHDVVLQHEHEVANNALRNIQWSGECAHRSRNKLELCVMSDFKSEFSRVNE